LPVPPLRHLEKEAPSELFAARREAPPGFMESLKVVRLSAKRG
jgi:hypothetical protein